MTATATKEVAHDLKEGDVLSSSWGYDQTNWDFYRVVRVMRTMVEVHQLKTEKVEDPNGFMTGKIRPTDELDPTEKPFRRRVRGGWDGGLKNVISIASYSSASPWSGSPEHYTSYA